MSSSGYSTWTRPGASARTGCIRPMLLISAIRSARKPSSRTSSASDVARSA